MIAERRGEALSLALVVGDAAKAQIRADDAMESRGVLVDRLHCRVFERGESRRVRGMTMQENARLRPRAMEAAVDGPGRGVRRAGTLHHLGIVGVEQQEIARSDGREMAPARIHQEPAPVGRDGGAEVVADRFVPIELHRQPKRGGQIDAQHTLARTARIGAHAKRPLPVSTR